MSYIGQQPVSGAFQKLDSISAGFNGVTTTFALKVGGVSVIGGTSTNLIIVLSGVPQEPETSFTISGSNIIFGTAPVSSDTFFGIRLGNVGTITTVNDGSVGLTKVDSNVLSATNHVVTPVGSVTSSNVQAAIAELDTNTSSKQPKLTSTIVSTTTQTAVANGHYLLTNVAATTVTLPASPVADSLVWVTVANSLSTNIVARNGQTIMGLTEDMTLNGGLNQTYQFKFLNNSWRLV